MKGCIPMTRIKIAKRKKDVLTSAKKTASSQKFMNN
jgi:hypothetical protein